MKNRRMKQPIPLKAGDTIAVVAPAGAAGDPLTVIKGIQVLKAMGFEVQTKYLNTDAYRYLAGEDAFRAQALMDAFLDDEVDGILCLRGGYGAMRILDLLSYDQIACHPKTFVGYSDITALHTVLNQVCGMVTFHGPMLSSDLGGKIDALSLKCMYDALTGQYRKALSYINEQGTEMYGTEEKAEGILCGGNLTLLASTLGTPYEIDTASKLLVMEEIGETPYRVDRMLTQLRLSGKLGCCAGFILGDFHMEGGDEAEAELWKIVKEILMPYRKPILRCRGIGHGSPKFTVPLGMRAEIGPGGLRLV